MHAVGEKKEELLLQTYFWLFRYTGIAKKYIYCYRWYRGIGYLDQIFLCDPVVLESICFRTRAKRLRNESKTTGGLRKIWTGSQ